MHSILLVEDDPQIRQFLYSALSSSYRVLPCGSLKDAELELTRTLPSLILLDVSLPDGDGFRFCAELRQRESLGEIPVIFLTSHDDLSAKLMGLSIGAEDYITKPFQMPEVRARIELRLKKNEASKAKQSELRIHDLFLSLSYLKASIISPEGNEIPLELTPLEFKLLLHLATHEDQVFSRKQIIDKVWGKTVHVSDRVVDTHLSNLRKKLASTSLTVFSVHGAGYKICRKDKAA